MAAVSLADTLGCRKMAISTPPFHWMEALLMACRMMSTPPSADSATAMVTIADSVISRLRRRLIPVSRAT